MGRKGGGGGTAGGGRSGKRGNITFNRVVPKFLQNLHAQQARKQEDARTTNKCDGDRRSDKQQALNSSWEMPPADVVSALEREGFNVVQPSLENEAKANVNAGNEISNKESSSLERTEKHSRIIAREGGVARGGIKKSAVRGERPAKVLKANKQRLSFANRDDDSDETD